MGKLESKIDQLEKKLWPGFAEPKPDANRCSFEAAQEKRIARKELKDAEDECRARQGSKLYAKLDDLRGQTSTKLSNTGKIY